MFPSRRAMRLLVRVMGGATQRAIAAWRAGRRLALHREGIRMRIALPAGGGERANIGGSTPSHHARTPRASRRISSSVSPADHQSGLGRDLRMPFVGIEQPRRCAITARACPQYRRAFPVVFHYVGRCRTARRARAPGARGIQHQTSIEVAAIARALRGCNRQMLTPPSAQVVAVHAGDATLGQLQFAESLRGAGALPRRAREAGRARHRRTGSGGYRCRRGS